MWQLQRLVEEFHFIKRSGDIAKTLQSNYQFRFASMNMLRCQH